MNHSTLLSYFPTLPLAPRLQICKFRAASWPMVADVLHRESPSPDGGKCSPPPLSPTSFFNTHPGVLSAPPFSCICWPNSHCSFSRFASPVAAHPPARVFLSFPPPKIAPRSLSSSLSFRVSDPNVLPVSLFYSFRSSVHSIASFRSPSFYSISLLEASQCARRLAGAR